MPVILVLRVAGIAAPATGQETLTGPPGGLLRALEAEISELFETNRRCVVRVHTIYDSDVAGLGFGNGYTHGTGFLIDGDGPVLTVDKAVKGASEIRVTLADGQTSRASFVASDPTSDVAVIRVSEAPEAHIAFGNSDQVRVGHYTFVLGNAFGELLPSIGSVYEVAEGEDLIQITSSVYPSYGGAPVFDSSGRVMGMVWAAPLCPHGGASLQPVSDQPTSVFVIPINRARRVATHLIESGHMTYGWLGVEVDRESHPVLVTRVAKDGPAWRSGLRPGDHIVTYNGLPVAGPYHLERLVMETAPGDSVPIRVRRESITMSTQALVSGRESGSPVIHPNGQLIGMSVSPAEQELFQKIQTLERELGRLRTLMQKSP